MIFSNKLENCFIKKSRVLISLKKRYLTDNLSLKTVILIFILFYFNKFSYNFFNMFLLKTNFILYNITYNVMNGGKKYEQKIRDVI
jgi:hypothetical protein